MPLFETIGLVKKFSEDGVETPVLKGISLKIGSGETVGIVGPSGAGKSTLLHILGTLLPPTAGQVLFEGEDLFSRNEGERAAFRNATIGFVFQFHHLLPDFSAVENVSLPLLIRGRPRPEAIGSARVLLEKVGLGSRMEARPAQLSGGEQQRVAIARAVVGRPRVILADEPTGNLDGGAAGKIFDLLLELNGELKTTLVAVTHNEALASRLSRRLHLVDGAILKTP